MALAILFDCPSMLSAAECEDPCTASALSSAACWFHVHTSQIILQNVNQLIIFCPCSQFCVKFLYVYCILFILQIMFEHWVFAAILPHSYVYDSMFNLGLVEQLFNVPNFCLIKHQRLNIYNKYC